MVHGATHRLSLKLVQSCVTSLCLLPFCVSSSLAGVDICRQPAPHSHLSIAFSKQQASSIEPASGEVKQENSRFDLQLQLRNDWSAGAGHRYTILSVDPLQPQTNGHLHTYFLALHKQRRLDNSSMRFSIAPALSASSNIAKKPADYRADALQVLAALIWSRQLSDRSQLWYGACGDHRFGGYQVYPSVGIELQPADDWIIELGFPASQLTHRISPSLASALRIGPDGNEWYVEDEGLEKQSRVLYEAWLLELDVEWQTNEHFLITVGVGRQFRNRFELTLLDDSRVQFHSDPATRFSAAVAWRF